MECMWIFCIHNLLGTDFPSAGTEAAGDLSTAWARAAPCGKTELCVNRLLSDFQQVQSSSKTLETNIGLSQQHNNGGSGKIPQDCMRAPLPVKHGNPGQRSHEVRVLKGKRREVLACAPGSSELRRPFSCPGSVPLSRPCWAAAPGRNVRAPLGESRGQRGAETDVDTGLALGSPGSSPCPLSLFPQALRSSLRQLPSPGATGSARDGTRTRTRTAAARNRAALGGTDCSPQTPRNGPAQPGQEEEFFI